MSIFRNYLRKCDFDARLERFFDQSIMIEPEDIEALKSEYVDICPLPSIINLDCNETDADDILDAHTTAEYRKSKILADVSSDLDTLFRIYFGFLMSFRIQDDFMMLDRFEEDYFDQLDNMSQKNYEPIIRDDYWDDLPMDMLWNMNFKLARRIETELLRRIMQNPPKIDVMDGIEILERYIDNYDPSDEIWNLIERKSDVLTDLDALIESLNANMQDFVFPDEDGNPSKKDYKMYIFMDCVIGGI